MRSIPKGVSESRSILGSALSLLDAKEGALSSCEEIIRRTHLHRYSPASFPSESMLGLSTCAVVIGGLQGNTSDQFY